MSDLPSVNVFDCPACGGHCTGYPAACPDCGIPFNWDGDDDEAVSADE